VTSAWLDGYRPHGTAETADVERVRRLLAAGTDPWSRATPLHLTASALVLHPATGRVLLRWHQRQQRWLQVGGHGDPGESDPLAIALREAAEETGLPDLVPWPDERLCHIAVCAVAPGKGEPAHEHADLRYLFATQVPEAIRPEDEGSPLRWLTIGEARHVVGVNNITVTLDRAEQLLAALR
jgi:8-oxo-dGTP pyrophosphatase MutT (NUDIX family)